VCRAIASSFPASARRAAEIRAALEGGIRQFNVESEPEMRAISEVAVSLGTTAPIAIRVNPDVDAQTHAKIATGKSENKFGIPIARPASPMPRPRACPGLRVVGIDVHIGSQLTELAPFEMAFRKVADLTETLRAEGHRIDRLDLGGGLGIPYTRSNEAPPLPTDYGAMIKRTLGHLDCEIEIEPGRLISGNSGLLVAQVIYVKNGEGRDFLILDAAMNDLIRPAMYEAHHDILPGDRTAPGEPTRPFDVVGPVCETGDTFAKAANCRCWPRAIWSRFAAAGAYGAVMASEYNSRPLMPEVLVHGDHFAVIRERPTFDEMIARDKLPRWL
jgi:diaminopimelate decarboxylase